MKSIIVTFDEAGYEHRTKVEMSNEQAAAYKQWKKTQKEFNGSDMLCDFLGIDTPEQAASYAAMQRPQMVMAANA